MNHFNSLALLALSTNLLVGCVAGDNITPPADPIEFPRSCAEAGVADGDSTLFAGGEASKPWVAYCSSGLEYLTLLHDDMTWSLYRAGGRSTGTDVRTQFDKIRIDPITFQVDVTDTTFAISTGSLTDPTGKTITELPLGVGMTCGGGSSNAQVDIRDTPFLLEDKFGVTGDAGAVGHAGIWEAHQTMEMWTDGDCATVGPLGTLTLRYK